MLLSKLQQCYATKKEKYDLFDNSTKMWCDLVCFFTLKMLISLKVAHNFNRDNISNTNQYDYKYGDEMKNSNLIKLLV